jgi:hypothetical protein
MEYLNKNTYELTIIRNKYGKSDLDNIVLETLTELNQKKLLKN